MKPGRPRNRPRERSQLSLLCSPRTRRLIERAADKSGRSMAQEIEHRIERSFHKDWIIDQLERRR